MFQEGQEVVCVDASTSPSPAHRDHPLVFKKVYVVRKVARCDCCTPGHIGVVIDNSHRAWLVERFRPIQYDLDLSFHKTTERV